MHSCLQNFFQRILVELLSAPFHQMFTIDRLGKMIWRRLIDYQYHEVLSLHIFIDLYFYLAFGQLNQIIDQIHF